MEPLPLVTITSLEVPVKVALVRVLPDVLPMRSWPSVYVVWPVPPLPIGSVFVTELVRDMLVKVLAEPDMDLFVSVSVVAL